MSQFRITFEPDLPRAAAPASPAWIRALDWTEVPKRAGSTEVLIIFAVDGDRFAYYPDDIPGVLGEQISIWELLSSTAPGHEICFSVQTYTVLCAENVGAALQFYDPSASYDSAQRLPLERLRLVGEPVAVDAVDIEMRIAIATLARSLDLPCI